MTTANPQIREFLIDQVDDHPRDIVPLTAERFGITRQAVHRHLAKLVEDGVIEAEGTTRNKEYKLAETVFEHELVTDPSLDEDRVWRTYVGPRLDDLPDNVQRLCHYGFTEILNNAIDHSEGTEIRFAVFRTAAQVSFLIRDNGVGIFEKIKRRFDLEDHRHAILELSKGKLTTDPARHSGQGIFFTSRMFDGFSIGSNGLVFSHQRDKKDLLFEDRLGTEPGTVALMTISVKSSLTPKEVFDRFTDPESDDYDFSKTVVPLRLARYGKEDLVSRSQAKRALSGLERFKEVLLNFDEVDAIGQAFADEIFRVFARRHPEIRLLTANANEDVSKMIRRAVAARKAEEGEPPSPA